MSRPEHRAVFTAAKEKNALIIWAIFERPADFPEHFVLRAQFATRNGVENWPDIWTADTLAKVRDMLPPVGLTCMPRRYGDPPHLIEVWL